MIYNAKSAADSDKKLFPSDWELPAFDIIELFPKRTRYCLGIPVINEGERLHNQLARMHNLKVDELIDIVIADGGSQDRSTSPDTLKSSGVRVLLTKRGTGKLSAQLRMFFAYALYQGYEGFVIIDGNNKDGVEAISEFIRALDEGWDYVQGSRYLAGGFEENTPLFRKLAVKLIHAPLLSLGSGFHYTDTTNGFRAIGKKFLQDDKLKPFRHVFDTYNLHYYFTYMAPRLGYRVKEIPVSRIYPKNVPAPTKIHGINSCVHIMVLLLKTIIGAYRPADSQQ